MTGEQFLTDTHDSATPSKQAWPTNISTGSQDGTPKHLRTGLANVMADVGSLGRLLIAKGIITEAEYFNAILDGLRREVAVYEHRLEERLGTKVTLG